MLIICAAALMGFIFGGINPLDDNRIIQGKLIDADADDKIITLVTDEGLLTYIAIDISSLVYNSQSISQSGFRDSCLKRGIPIKIILHKSNYLIKELHYSVKIPQ